MKAKSMWELKNATYGFLDFLIKFGLSKHQVPRLQVEKFIRRHKSQYDKTPNSHYDDYLI